MITVAPLELITYNLAKIKGKEYNTKWVQHSLSVVTNHSSMTI
jgi:hypothetical protein